MTLQTLARKSTIDTAQIDGLVTDLLQRTAAQGYMALKPDVVEMYQFLKEKLPEAPVDFALETIQKFSPVLYESMKELSRTDTYLMEELELADDVVFVCGITDTKICHTLMIKNNEFEYSLEAPKQADLSVFMDENTYRRVMTGEVDAMDAFMDGLVNLEGSVTSCVSLRAIFEVLCDQFGFKIIDFG